MTAILDTTTTTTTTIASTTAAAPAASIESTGTVAVDRSDSAATKNPIPVGPAASITPPHSNDGKRDVSDEGVPSELSDLELDAKSIIMTDAPVVTQEVEVKVEDKKEQEEIQDEILPDHYYGNGTIPVFKPTMDQFRDFQAFIHKVDHYGMKSGIVKVIPPKEWSASLPPLDEAVKRIRVKNPIMQEFHGSHGTYTQANIERQRSYNLPQWKALCEESSHQPPARRGERRRNQERAPRPASAPKPPVNRGDRTPKRRPGRPVKRSNHREVKEETPADDGPDKTKPEGPPTPVSPESNPVEAKTEVLSEGESLPPPKPKGRQPKSVTARRKWNRGDTLDQVDEEAFRDFDYRIHDSEDYTAERCEELETAYWKSLMFNNPLYGADMPGSLFDDSTTSWNVAKLPNLLDVLGQKLPGVNTAYLYLGMWKATFAWHLEDVDLYSINYIHFGAPKQWYSISQEDAPRFEQAMRSIWTSDAKNCDQFLRHKTYLVSPSILKSQYGINVNRLVHYEGEFVITYPYGYHSGFNLGYNCAESVNFATEKWLDYGRIAKKCHCEADSVWIDVEEIERKLRGETTPEFYDGFGSDLDGMEGVSDLLTPPRSVPDKHSGGGLASGRGRKRKHPGDERKIKRPRMHAPPRRKIPCLLCPNDLDYEELLPTEDGKSHAHRRCALYTEETTILRDDLGREVVCDIDLVPKARMGLKCLYCREVRGACFQCNFGKCTRAYHATCALLAGVQVEMGSIAVIGDDGVQYSIPSVDLKCKFHRQKRQTGLPGESSADADRKIIEAASRLKPDDQVQFQADKEINGAVVLENRREEQTLLLKVLPRGDVIELPYRWMLVVRKSNFTPLPPGTKPLPAHLVRKPEARRELESAVPVPGTPFLDAQSPYRWAEFETVALRDTAPPLCPPGYRDANQQPQQHHQLWHYLGPSSTESRAQYTHNPSIPVHNPKANFLDSVKALLLNQQQQQQQSSAALPVGASLSAAASTSSATVSSLSSSGPGAGSAGSAALARTAPTTTGITGGGSSTTATATTATTTATTATFTNITGIGSTPTASSALAAPSESAAKPNGLSSNPHHDTRSPPITAAAADAAHIKNTRCQPTSTGTPTTAAAVAAPPIPPAKVPSLHHRLSHPSQRPRFARPPRPPPPTSSSSVPPSSSSSSFLSPSSAAAAAAMPSAYRTLPNHSSRYAPYSHPAKTVQPPHQLQQQQHAQSQQTTTTSPTTASRHRSQSQSQGDLTTNSFANVRELIARRRLAQITEHANVFAGYTIVSPELVVETLLGPMGSVPPSNGLEKLELAMAQRRVQPRAADGTLLPLQPLNMRSEEVTRLLQMLRFSLVSYRERLDVVQKKESEQVKQEIVDKATITAAKMPGKYAYLDQQRAQVPAVYQSPYNMPSGFSEYAKKTFELVPEDPAPPKESLANDYFASLCQRDQEKILKTCGSFVQRAMERSAPHSRQNSSNNVRLATALARQMGNPTIDITTAEDLPLSALDLPLHADSPISSFSRSHLQFQSPNDFANHVDHHDPSRQLNDHHDLFGDQQANTRFWQHGPWVASDGNTPNEENRPFFGPHERLKHDYASSDISLGRGPGSLHSVDMAGFGLDATDDIGNVLSP